MRRASFDSKKGVSLILLKSLPKPLRWRGCHSQKLFFYSKIQLSLFLLTILSLPTNSLHSPLHSERGWGWGCFFNSKIWLPLFPFTIHSHPTSSFHSPLHSERGWGWGFSWVGSEALLHFKWYMWSLLVGILYLPTSYSFPHNRPVERIISRSQWAGKIMMIRFKLSLSSVSSIVYQELS